MSETKDDDEYSEKALQALREMIFHKLRLWDAASRLEEELGVEVETGDRLSELIAAGFSDADEALRLSRTEASEYVGALLGLDDDSMGDEP